MRQRPTALHKQQLKLGLLRDAWPKDAAGKGGGAGLVESQTCYGYRIRWIDGYFEVARFDGFSSLVCQ
jgi:hypothetical protein